MLQDLDDAGLEQEAANIVDDYMDEGLSIAEAQNKTNKISDIDTRKAVEMRADYIYRKRDLAEVEAQSDVIDTYLYDVRRGDLTINEIPKDKFEMLSANQKEQFIQAQNNSVKSTKVESNRESY